MSLFSAGNTAAIVGLGVAAGVLSGLVGVGGGIIIVPALAFLLGFEQHRAQGTTLAMLLPPVGILATWTYWKHGFVDLPIAMLLAAGFLVGAWGGAKLAVAIPTAWLERVFGILMIGLGAKMLFKF